VLCLAYLINGAFFLSFLPITNLIRSFCTRFNATY